VQNIRIGDVDTNSSLLTKEWDLSIDDQEAEFREDLRAASGIGRKRGGKVYFFL
jgi:general transcription factor 3C polypeptide 3 (transcription factor C subunit 4)